MYESLRAGKRVTLDRVGTFADGVAVPDAVPVTQRRVHSTRLERQGTRSRGISARRAYGAREGKKRLAELRAGGGPSP